MGKSFLPTFFPLELSCSHKRGRVFYQYSSSWDCPLVTKGEEFFTNNLPFGIDLLSQKAKSFLPIFFLLGLSRRDKILVENEIKIKGSPVRDDIFTI
jgi:hypothetical protein